jgi:hypothetical protein
MMFRGRTGKKMDQRCGDCIHFRNDPAFLESSFPGLTSFSSGYASVCADDGMCARHGRYLSASASCAEFTPREAAA